MKNIFFILLAFFSVLSLNSCREDGDWGNENGGQFGFTIDRDADFIEKGLGESNQLKFNINPSYDFASIKTSFKFTTNLNGTLKLNGETLNANQEYTFTTKDNIFEYIGNTSGTHELKISVKNDKGGSKEEEFKLKYSISEFTLVTAGGAGTLYQGEATVYNHKITPSNPGQATGYQIRFDTYTGEIKLNDVPAVIGTYYPISNIESFNVSLLTNQKGAGKLTYTIKNSTVAKPYEIQQNITGREITIETMNVNATTVVPNREMSLIGVIKKSPVTANKTVEYKTWISSASNNNINGIENTNNMYRIYALGANGDFKVLFNALTVGEYTYNIQMKDEFGNESEIKTFQIIVQPKIWFDNEQSSTLMFTRNKNSGDVWRNLHQVTFGLHTGSPAIITKIKYTLTVNSTLGSVVRYSEETPNTSDVKFENTAINIEGFQYWTNTPVDFKITSATLKIEAINSLGDTLQTTITPVINYN